MANFKHTPGPWEVDSHNPAKVVRRNDHNDRLRLFVDQCCTSPIKGEVEANARLIAAAPRLLEALKVVYQHMESGLPWEEVKRVADTAIVAAESETE